MPLDVVRRLLRPLREPVVTSRYPAEPLFIPAGSHGLPVVDPARCSRDGACVTACPTGAIELVERGWALDAGRCVFCSACVIACPNEAIWMGDRIELAARDRARLVEITRLESRP